MATNISVFFENHNDGELFCCLEDRGCYSAGYKMFDFSATIWNIIIIFGKLHDLKIT